MFVIISYVSNKRDWIIAELQLSQPLLTAVHHAQEIWIEIFLDLR